MKWSIPEIRRIIAILGTMAMYALFYKALRGLGIPEIVIIPVGWLIFGPLAIIAASDEGIDPS